MLLLTWLGFAGTGVFGMLNLYQLHRYFVDKKIYDANREHLVATKESLQHLRAMFTEAIEREGVVHEEPTRQLLRDTAYHLLSAEAHIDAILRQLRVA